jgi:hypothetical protein
MFTKYLRHSRLVCPSVRLWQLNLELIFVKYDDGEFYYNLLIFASFVSRGSVVG